MDSRYSGSGSDLTVVSTLLLFVAIIATSIAFAAVGLGVFEPEPSARLHVLVAPPTQLAAETNTDGIDATVTSSTMAAVDVPVCHVEICAQAYLSFRASDCTFQPYDGPRKLCVR